MLVLSCLAWGLSSANSFFAYSGLWRWSSTEHAKPPNFLFFIPVLPPQLVLKNRSAELREQFPLISLFGNTSVSAVGYACEYVWWIFCAPLCWTSCHCMCFWNISLKKVRHTEIIAPVCDLGNTFRTVVSVVERPSLFYKNWRVFICKRNGGLLLWLSCNANIWGAQSRWVTFCGRVAILLFECQTLTPCRLERWL